MKIAVLPRYLNLKKENYDFNLKHYVNHDYILMAQKMGVGLCAIMSPYECEDYASFCDGLIIPGSYNKVNPVYYGGKPMNPPPECDEFALDIKVIDAFAKANKPIFGICAGHQAINIYFGGTKGSITEDGTKPHSNTTHCINIKPGSFVYDAFKSERAEINSFHVMHINNIGKDLTVTAKSDDGIIEAIENKERRIFGVQWHPELCFKKENSPEMKLFENFVKMLRK